jgi:hypothetical protein
LAKKIRILYPGISIAKEVFRILISPFCSYYGSYNVQSHQLTWLNWQDVPLCLVEHYRAADSSSTLLVPGYKFMDRFMAVGHKMGIFVFGY